MTRLRADFAGARDRFLAALRRTATTQRDQLTAILAANRDTEFGRDHGFSSIDSPETFRRYVPVRGYGEFESFLVRMAGGERGVLCAGDPVVFEETGGSTAGPKLIPYTAAGLEAFRRALYAWLDDLLAARPALCEGRWYWSLSPAARERRATPGGIPIGMESDAAFFGEAAAEDLAAVMAVPPELAAIADLETWRARTVQSLREAGDLTLISVWSPTFLLELLPHLPPVEEIWPRLDTISCWTGGASAGFAQQLRGRFPKAFLQGKGLLATEAVVTIPVAGCVYPVPAVESGFYEFLTPDGASHLCHELSPGRVYRVVVTTHSGLYRYDLGDQVRVHASDGIGPQLEYAGRAGLVSDLCGEKLTEDFVVSCLASIPGFAMLAPSLQGRGHYVLFVEAEPDGLAERVDAALSANPQYAYARRLGQLGPLAVQRTSNALARYQAHELRRGRRLGDIKPAALSKVPGWEAVFGE